MTFEKQTREVEKKISKVVRRQNGVEVGRIYFVTLKKRKKKDLACVSRRLRRLLCVAACRIEREPDNVPFRETYWNGASEFAWRNQSPLADHAHTTLSLI